jgi:Cobyric acid synthase
MTLIFLGTSSGAGKTTLTAMYCRHLSSKGRKVVPFKASNLSLNSFVTKEGKEIGMGQAFQAWASGIEPTGDMNPILLKPSGDGNIQLILNGELHSDITKGNPMDVGYATEQACKAFDELREEYDTVICEGSGSPAELNLRDRDIANIGMVRERKIPAVLVGDIERGGVFAALYGTWLLFPDDLKPYLKGFVINLFRGDAEILKKGTDRIEELTGMKFLGVVPRLELKFPEEDSLSRTDGKLVGSDVKKAFIDNLDTLLCEAKKGGLDLAELDSISEN